MILTTLAGLPIKWTSDVVDLGFNITLYGPGGAGKTTLAASINESEFGYPAFYVNRGSGLSVVQDKHLPYTETKSWGDLEKVLDAFKAPVKPPIKSVILDNISEMLELCIRSEAPTGMPTQPEWNKISTKYLNYIRDWRNLTEAYALNVVFVAWDEPNKDDLLGLIKMEINANPAIRKAFPGIVDTVGHISAEQGTPNMRLLNFAPGPRTIAKFRRAPTSVAMKIPFEIRYKVDDLPFPAILDTLKGGKSFPERYMIKPA